MSCMRALLSALALLYIKRVIVAMAAFKESFATICKAVVPFIVIMGVWLLIVATVPALSLFLVGK